MGLHIRVRIEVALAIAFAVLCGLTALHPAWLESGLGLSLDRADGELEIGLTLALGTVAAMLALRARRDWRRALAQRSTEATHVR